MLSCKNAALPTQKCSNKTDTSKYHSSTILILWLCIPPRDIHAPIWEVFIFLRPLSSSINEDNNSNLFTRLLQRSNEIMHVRCYRWCSFHSVLNKYWELTICECMLGTESFTKHQSPHLGAYIVRVRGRQQLTK